MAIFTFSTSPRLSKYKSNGYFILGLIIVTYTYNTPNFHINPTCNFTPIES